jgi:hypothetical protein
VTPIRFSRAAVSFNQMLQQQVFPELEKNVSLGTKKLFALLPVAPR